MSNSVDRVIEAAHSHGLDITVRRMPRSTRSAADAAKACDCEIGQIVKSLIFEGTWTDALKLVLVSGRHELNLNCAVAIFGEPLRQTDPKRVRSETGFAIGGVAPIGHISPLATWMDDDLLNYQKVWAAAGAPNAVFCVDPEWLAQLPGVQLFTNPSPTKT